MSARQSPNWSPGPTAPWSVSAQPLGGCGFPNAHLFTSLVHGISIVTSERQESQAQSRRAFYPRREVDSTELGDQGRKPPPTFSILGAGRGYLPSSEINVGPPVPTTTQDITEQPQGAAVATIGLRICRSREVWSRRKSKIPALDSKNPLLGWGGAKELKETWS